MGPYTILHHTRLHYTTLHYTILYFTTKHKTKGGHDQIQIQIHKYKYKFAHTNTNTNTERAPESNFDILPKNKSFHENGHISGTVGPTSPQHHSNRSSWRARPEKHLRGSLTCPGNTGEPKAPVSGCNRHIELGPEAKK